MSKPQPITLDAQEYIETLRMSEDQNIVKVTDRDGAHLVRVHDDHFLIVDCTAHRHHGRALLERTLPADWVCFASAVNVEERFEVYHYGPDQ